MNYLLIFLNFFTVFNVFCFKIKIGKNINKYVFNQLEYKKDKDNENVYRLVDGKGIKKNEEALFLLL